MAKKIVEGKVEWVISPEEDSEETDNRGYLAAKKLRVMTRNLDSTDPGFQGILRDIRLYLNQIEGQVPMRRSRVMPRISKIRTYLEIIDSRLLHQRLVYEKDLKSLKKLAQQIHTIPGLPSSDAEDKLTAIRYQLKRLEGGFDSNVAERILETISMIVNPPKMTYNKKMKEVTVYGDQNKEG